jgi:hypothetical protein
MALAQKSSALIKSFLSPTYYVHMHIGQVRLITKKYCLEKSQREERVYQTSRALHNTYVHAVRF